MARSPGSHCKEGALGIVVQFPEGLRPLSGGRYVDANSEPANVIILPVIRIERSPDEPSDGMSGGGGDTPGRRRRRRASRL
jgi:hypothetical protein